MKKHVKTTLLTALTLLFTSTLIAQTLEYYAGDKRTGVDLMWFKYVKNAKQEPTSFLFFSRNRASVDYHNSPTLFGSTNALSYNLKNGLGLVAVASFQNVGFITKAGVQFYANKKDFLFFGWLVVDIKNKGAVDCFGMFRYQPKINENWRAFGQLELFPIYNPSTENWNNTERVRLGMRYQPLGFGFFLDANQTGKTNLTTSENTGAFVRYEF